MVAILFYLNPLSGVMATETTQSDIIEIQFNSFAITYGSLDLGDARNPGTQCWAYITCYDKNQAIGFIKFYERQPPPINSYRGSRPMINFHVSRFNDIISILRYHKPLAISFDLIKLDGYLMNSERELIGQQEPTT